MRAIEKIVLTVILASLAAINVSAAKTVKVKLTGSVYENILMTIGYTGRTEVISNLPYKFEIPKDLLPLKLKFQSDNYIYYDIDVPKKTNDATGHIYVVKIKEAIPISFTNYVKNEVQPELEAWQKRKEYETEEQWYARVNEQTNQAKIESLLSEAQDAYIHRYSPREVKGSLSDYDSEYGVYTVETENDMGNIYVKVPESEKEYFTKNWSKVRINPVLGIINDKVGILACEFFLDDKTYQSVRTYTMDNLNTTDFGFKPLESYLIEKDKAKEKTPLERSGKQHVVVESVADLVDIDIPSTGELNKNTFAVVIGNEIYSRGVPNVEFAGNDAKVFAKYCNKTLGVPEKNIRTYYDATYGDMLAAMRDIDDIAKAYKGKIKVIFYYAGHGLPDEESLEAYLLPVDADGHTTDGLYSLTKLYKQLSDLKAEETLVFLDACFSGASRGDDMLMAARGVRLKPQEVKPDGRIIVFSASTGRQSAFPYKEKGHGMFTYFLLEKLRQTKGDISMGELYEYVFENVSQQSVINNRKSQVPNLNISKDLGDNWSTVKLK